jgi:hypothetical protein
MTHENRGVSAVRASWAVLGGVWGAWAGFAGYLRVPNNPDSFGSMLAGGFFGLFALLGLVIGAVSGAVIGRSVERVMRRSGAGLIAAMSVATLVNAIALWALVEGVRSRFPGLRPE